MARKTISAVWEDNDKIVLREFDIPDIGPDEGLLKIEMAAICVGDAKSFKSKEKKNNLPIILGHEILGHIEKIGKIAKESYRVKEGDRVLVEKCIKCGRCYYCQIGSYNECEIGLKYGVHSSKNPPHLWGAYGQYMYLAPGSTLNKISEKIPAEAAAMTGNIANGIQWVRIIAQPSIGDTVVIEGPGPEGLSAIIAARESGVGQIIVTGLTFDKDRLKLAKELGAHHVIDVQREDVVEKVTTLTEGMMADMVVDLSGSPQGITTSIDLVRKQGTVISGGLTGKKVLVPLSVYKIVSRQIRFQGVHSKTFQATQMAIKLIESQKYPIEKMLTHKFPLKETAKALRTVKIEGEIPIREYPVKAAVVPWD
jgi:alcohol dehydrogenase